jgi:hypothetical protein
MRYDATTWEEAERQIRQDANFVVSGACNPVAVAGVLRDMLKALRHHKQDLKHPAALITLSHLSFLLCGENLALEAWAGFFQDKPKAAAC